MKSYQCDIKCHMTLNIILSVVASDNVDPLHELLIIINN